MRISDWSSDVCSSDLNNICSAVRESLSKFAAEGPPVSPSRSHRPAITARPLYISYQAQVERELDQAHLHAASALAQVAISCAAAAFSEFRAGNRFGKGEFLDHSDR